MILTAVHKQLSTPGQSPYPKKRRQSHVDEGPSKRRKSTGSWSPIPGHENSQKKWNHLNGHSTPSTMGNGWTKGKDSSTPVSKQKISKGHVPSSSIEEQRKNLPIASGRDAIIEEIRKNDVTVLLGETGSGKTTQVPQYLLESGLCGDGMIAVTQPRKVAATSLASRVASEQGTALGKLVGYAVRFDEKSSPETRIKYMTDGMIVRELLSDPLLSKYSVVIVDEAHERTLRTDILLANLKTIQHRRNSSPSGKGKGKESDMKPLKIVIMSATLNAEKFSKFFNNAKIIYVKGRQHTVKTFYSTTGQADYVDSAMRTFFQIHIDSAPGDVLIFLPGQEDIESLEKSIRLYAARLPVNSMEVLICPMYAAQASGQNSKVFSTAPHNTRKCILATNIAETSITIPGVKYVIDTGKCKEKRYLARDSGGGFDTLMTRDITKSSAMQRAGRAGREGPGFCFRLYTEDAFNAMPLTAEPEIRRCGLTGSMLQLRYIGQEIETLDLMDKPDEDTTISALKTLYLLGAINPQKELTSIGRKMAQLPLEPNYARAVVASKEFGSTREVLDIISILSVSSSLFIDISDQRDTIADARNKFRHLSGDHMTILNVMKAYEELVASDRKDWCKRHYLNERTLIEARSIREQLRQTCKRIDTDWKVSCGDDDEAVLHALAHGLVHNFALLQADKTYKQIMGTAIVKIHPSSSMCDKIVPAIMFNELIYTNQIYARTVSSISKRFIQSIQTLNQREA